MKLRTKSLLVICIVCSILFIVSTSLLHVVLMGSYFLDLEEKVTIDHVIRISNLFTQEYNDLRAIGSDWATWDDAYAFVENKNEQYIEMNLNETSFETIQINFMLFYNLSDSLVFEKAFDLNPQKEIHLPDSFHTYIYNNKESLLHDSSHNHSLAGLVLYSQNQSPVLLSVTPILQSNKQGPIRGTLIIGRFLNAEKLDYFGNITQLSVSVQPISKFSSLLTTDSSSNSKTQNIFIHPINTTYIVGSMVLEDIFGNPKILLEVGAKRDIYNQGLNVLQTLFISLFITTIFLVIMMIIILDKFVTSRLTTLSKSVREIQDFNDLSKQIEISGNDEISLLGKNVNNMLVSLQKTWAMKDSAELTLQKKIDELERFKTITIDRELKMIELKKQINELKEMRGETELNGR